MRFDGSRFCAVRFFLPDAGSTVEIYDRDEPNDRRAWSENEALYRCQLVATADDRAVCLARAA